MKRPSRMNFLKIRESYKKRGATDGLRLSQSSLLLTRFIDPATSTYVFDTLESQNTNLQPDEIRVNINDEFIATHMGVYLYGKVVQFPVLVPEISSPILLSYAPLELDTKAVTQKGLYAGQMKIGVNNVVYIEKWDTRKHEQTQRTQFASFIAGVPVCTLPSMEDDNDGMIAFEPMITISGAKKTEVSLSLPKAIAPQTYTFINQAGQQYNIVIDKIAVRFFGLNAQNASKFQ